MLPPLWVLAPPLLLPLAAAQSLPTPTLQFNVTLPLAALNNRGKWSKWATVYGNADGKGADVLAEGAPELRATARDPDLQLTAAAAAVYVYGDLGASGSMGTNKLEFQFAGAQPENKARDNAGLIGHAELDMFTFFEGSYAPLWMYFDAPAPRVERIVVTTGIETDAQSLEDVNVTTWRFVEDGALSPRFTWRETTGKWNTTQTYAAARGDEVLRAVSERANGAVSPPAGRNAFVVVQAPANTSWVALNVTRGPGFGGLSITSEPKIDGYPPESPTTYEEHYVPDEMAWFRSLDPRVRYNISLAAQTDIDHPGLPVALNSITFYGGAAAEDGAGATRPGGDGDGNGGGDGGDGGKKTNIGAIVGGVVGGVLGALALAVLAWFLLRRRKQAREDRERRPRLEIDDAPVVPYGAPGLPAGHAYDEKGRLVPVSTAQAQKLEEQQPLTPRARARAIDGGAAPEADEDVLDPPEYNPAWQGGAAPSATSAPVSLPTTSKPTEASPTAASPTAASPATGKM